MKKKKKTIEKTHNAGECKISVHVLCSTWKNPTQITFNGAVKLFKHTTTQLSKLWTQLSVPTFDSLLSNLHEADTGFRIVVKLHQLNAFVRADLSNAQAKRSDSLFTSL